MDGMFGTNCDISHFTTRLHLKLELPLERETVLHFFERLRRQFPRMTKMRRRDSGSLIIEEEDPEESQRWVRLDSSGLRFGFFCPPDLRAVRELSAAVLDNAPHHLTLSPLDLDHIEVVYGFDLEYRGNHDQLVADTFFGDHPLQSLVASDDLEDDREHPVVDCQPYFAFALTPDCDLQACFDIKGRTSTYEVRTRDYEAQAITVSLTVRKYWDLTAPGDLTAEQRRMLDVAEQLCTRRLIPVLVTPLAQAIVGRP